MPSYVPILILGGSPSGSPSSRSSSPSSSGKRGRIPQKSAVYECGVPAIGTARERFPIKFYLVCMLFILFDVDAAFLYPWALIFRQLGLYGLVEMAVFVFLLGGGFVYAWKVGALDW